MISKRYDLIYFCGDSWTHARHAEGVQSVAATIEQTFYHLIAQHYNLPYVQSAKGGAGNKWIYQTVYEDIPKLREQYKRILSIVGWSDCERVEIFNSSVKDIRNISVPPFTREFHKMYLEESYDTTIQYYMKETTTYIKSVRALYKCYNIDYIDAFAFRPENPFKLKVDFLGEGKILEETYLKICGDEGRIYMPEINNYGHQNNYGQVKIANALIKRIDELYGTGQLK